ncbi:unnamed protein product [Oncorhynchus mykiss]|uniref:Uncharacterized protein n=1 Tax=Oncorhynchus mykiss TaxID=8022 RepID=A0A060Z284_ONCMY|nr:unnamed protein product [Oncorhynchus mykiss]
MESDFHSPYNCTAWNSFGPGTMIITLEEKEIVPVGIIAGGTVGSSILLLIFLLALAFYLYRQRKGSESYTTPSLCMQHVCGSCSNWLPIPPTGLWSKVMPYTFMGNRGQGDRGTGDRGQGIGDRG